MPVTPDDARGLVSALLSLHRAARESPAPYGTRSTGSLGLDAALGGGYPVGAIAEIAGEDAAGKSTLALAAAAACTRGGGAVAWFDADRTLGTAYPLACGVAPARFIVCRPDSAEEGLAMVTAAIPSVDLVVVDSLAALAPRAELDARLGEAPAGALQRLLSAFTLAAVPLLRKHGTTLLAVDQLRARLGDPWGNPEATAGGRAIPYAAAVRLDVRKAPELDLHAGGRPVGVVARVTVLKPVADPQPEALVPITLGAGVDPLWELELLARREERAPAPEPAEEDSP